ncbi:MAG: hypothetical protein AAF675_07020 [Pseudomonadota bacterium]
MAMMERTLRQARIGAARRREATGEASTGRMVVAASADLAASMLGVALLLLAIVLVFRGPAPGEATTPERTPGAAEIAELFRHAAGRPLGAGEMSELMRRRVETPPRAASIDVTAEGLTLRASGGSAFNVPASQAPRRLQSFLASLAHGEPALVFVFDHALYGVVREAIDADGRPWTEFSPPEALRTPGGLDQGWSDAFLALVDEANNTQAFRAGLQELLQQPDAAEGAPETAAGDPPPPPEPLLDRLANAVTWFFALLALLIAAAIVASVERRRLRRLLNRS